MTERQIREAGKSLKILQITYEEKDGTNEGWREVEPYSIKEKGSNRLFFGWDIKKEGIRAFILASILSIKITEKTFSPRFPVEL